MGLWEQSGKSADEWSETTGSRPREGTPEALVFRGHSPIGIRKAGQCAQDFPEAHYALLIELEKVWVEYRCSDC